MEGPTAQVIAVCAAPLLCAGMMPMFWLLARKLGKTAGWHAGPAVYWLVGGVAYPHGLFGWDTVAQLVRSPGFGFVAVLLAAVPVSIAAAGCLFSGSGYEKTTRRALPALLARAVGNGLFEEILWRGVHMALFPDSIVWRVLWPRL